MERVFSEVCLSAWRYHCTRNSTSQLHCGHSLPVLSELAAKELRQRARLMLASSVHGDGGEKESLSPECTLERCTDAFWRTPATSPLPASCSLALHPWALRIERTTCPFSVYHLQVLAPRITDCARLASWALHFTHWPFYCLQLLAILDSNSSFSVWHCAYYSINHMFVVVSSTMNCLLHRLHLYPCQVSSRLITWRITSSMCVSLHCRTSVVRTADIDSLITLPSLLSAAFSCVVCSLHSQRTLCDTL